MRLSGRAAYLGCALCAVGISLGSDAALAGAPAVQSSVQPVALTPHPKAAPMTDIAVTFDPVSFAQLPDWEADDHLAAWKAFVTSCQPVLAAAASGAKSGTRAPPQALLSACELALLATRSGPPQTRAGARAFFEQHFTPHAVTHTGASGLFTGYYEPLVKGSRTPDAAFRTPVYRRPPDLVNVVAESERGAKSPQFTHMRQTADSRSSVRRSPWKPWTCWRASVSRRGRWRPVK